MNPNQLRGVNMNRRTVGIIAAIALAAVGTFVLVAYVRGAEDRAVAGEKMVDVVVASKTIDAGTAARRPHQRDARRSRCPRRSRADVAITSLKDVPRSRDRDRPRAG